MRKLMTVILVFLCVCGAADAKSKKKKNQPQNRPAVFDYYLLSLSWSPQYCADPQHANRDPDQCGTGRRFAFVVHGLWPNNNRPPHPSNCPPRSTVSQQLVTQMLQIMPSPTLIQHEWETHGTCSGMNQNDYFSTVRTAFRLVRIPDPYKQPAQDLRVAASEVRRNFQTSNPSFPRESIRLTCAGQFLNEARICFDKNLVPRACAPAINDSCGNRTITMRKVR